MKCIKFVINALTMRSWNRTPVTDASRIVFSWYVMQHSDALGAITLMN